MTCHVHVVNQVCQPWHDDVIVSHAASGGVCRKSDARPSQPSSLLVLTATVCTRANQWWLLETKGITNYLRVLADDCWIEGGSATHCLRLGMLLNKLVVVVESSGMYSLRLSTCLRAHEFDDVQSDTNESDSYARQPSSKPSCVASCANSSGCAGECAT